MTTFSDWDFYQNTYHGKLSEEQYQTAVGKAYYEIMSVTSGRAGNVEGDKTNLAMCECELTDVFYKLDDSGAMDTAGITSINNDGYSQSFESGDARNTYFRRKIYAICARYLQYPINLMCRWL